VIIQLDGKRKYENDVRMLVDGILMDLDSGVEAAYDIIDAYVEKNRIHHMNEIDMAKKVMDSRNLALQKRVLHILLVVNFVTCCGLIILALLNQETMQIMLRSFLVMLVFVITEMLFFYAIHRRYVYVDTMAIKLGGKVVSI
jgi:hypothetical protein